MDWQLFAVVVLVVLALIYLGRQTLRAWSGKSSGCGGCKCPGTTSAPRSDAEKLIPLERVRLRRR